jgi:hypothetical protein
MRPIEPVKWIGRADAPILFLSGRNDELVPPADARKYQQAAHEPKDVRWYDSGHLPPTQGMCDAARWLEKRIGIAADKHPACELGQHRRSNSSSPTSSHVRPPVPGSRGCLRPAARLIDRDRAFRPSAGAAGVRLAIPLSIRVC